MFARKIVFLPNLGGKAVQALHAPPPIYYAYGLPLYYRLSTLLPEKTYRSYNKTRKEKGYDRRERSHPFVMCVTVSGSVRHSVFPRTFPSIEVQEPSKGSESKVSDNPLDEALSTLYL